MTISGSVFTGWHISGMGIVMEGCVTEKGRIARVGSICRERCVSRKTGVCMGARGCIMREGRVRGIVSILMKRSAMGEREVGIKVSVMRNTTGMSRSTIDLRIDEGKRWVPSTAEERCDVCSGEEDFIVEYAVCDIC